MCTLKHIAPFLPDEVTGQLPPAVVPAAAEEHHLWDLMDAAVRRRVDIEYM